MTTMNISLTDELKEYIDNKVSSGRFSSASEYIRDLVRREEVKSAEDELRRELMLGMESGYVDYNKNDFEAFLLDLRSKK